MLSASFLGQPFISGFQKRLSLIRFLRVQKNTTATKTKKANISNEAIKMSYKLPKRVAKKR